MTVGISGPQRSGAVGRVGRVGGGVVELWEVGLLAGLAGLVLGMGTEHTIATA